jgi:hypothetical protein
MAHQPHVVSRTSLQISTANSTDWIEAQTFSACEHIAMVDISTDLQALHIFHARQRMGIIASVETFNLNAVGIVAERV